VRMPGRAKMSTELLRLFGRITILTPAHMRCDGRVELSSARNRQSDLGILVSRRYLRCKSSIAVPNRNIVD